MFKSKLLTKIISCGLVFSLIACSTNFTYAKEENVSDQNSNTIWNNAEITNNLVNDGWITKDNNNNIYFTEKYVNNLKENEQNKDCTIYVEKNCIRIVNNLTGGQNAFIWNQRQNRWELFLSHDTTQNIVNTITAGGSIFGIIATIVPISAPVTILVTALAGLGSLAFSIKDKGNGVVVLLHQNFMPYWVSTQA